MIPSKSLGFSLLEVLITLVIGGVILNGIFQVILSSKEKFNQQKEIAYIQENARYILDVLRHDIRMAGYSGCQPLYSGALYQSSSKNNPVYLGLYGIAHNLNTRLPDAELKSRLNHYSDAIVVSYAGEKKRSIGPLFEHQLAGNHSVSLNKEYAFFEGKNIIEGQNFLFTDSMCSRQYIISPSLSFSHAATKNTLHFKVLDKHCVTPSCNDLPESVNLEYAASPITSHAYFIEQSNTVPGALALKKLNIHESKKSQSVIIKEIATGIEALQFFYGVDSDGLGGINEYRSAKDMDINKDGQTDQQDWQTVRAVRVDFLLTSRSPLFKKPQTVIFNGKPYPGLFMRKAFSATVNVRNAHYVD